MSKSKLYSTYQQIVVRAIVELQQLHKGSRSRSFHTNTIHKKIRDFAQAEEVHLGPHWMRRVTKAITELVEENVVRKKHGFITLSSKGVRNLASSRKHYGSLHELSPFKKSQFLKDISGSPSTTRSSGAIIRNSLSQHKTIASLRASLAKAKGENQAIAFELENIKKERDDFQLALLGIDRPSTNRLPLQADKASAENLDDSGMSCVPVTSPERQSMVPDRELTSVPCSELGLPNASRQSPVDSRPTTSFIHRSSGSFLNSISNQFTPSPSPVPAQNDTVGICTSGESDIDKADALDSPDIEMGDVDDGADHGNSMERTNPDVPHGQSAHDEMSPKTLCIDIGSDGAAKSTTSLESAQPLEMNEDREVLTQKLVLITQERDLLQRTEEGLHAVIKGCTDHIDSLNVDLASVKRALDTLQTQKDACEDVHVTTQAENARLLREIADRTSEVTRLSDRIAELSVECSLSNVQRDDTQIQLTSTNSQLKATETRLVATYAELEATQVQLRGAHDDLRTIWERLQASEGQRATSEEQLASAQLQIHDVHSELEATRAQMDVVTALFNDTSDQLQVSKTHLDATNVQLDGVTKDLQRLQDDIRQAKELECRLRDEVKDITDTLFKSRTELTQLTQQSAVRENGLKSRIEEAHELIAVLEEDLQAAQTAWTRAMDIRRAVQVADEEVQQSLFRHGKHKRDNSFRDSGVSLAM